MLPLLANPKAAFHFTNSSGSFSDAPNTSCAAGLFIEPSTYTAIRRTD